MTEPRRRVVLSLGSNVGDRRRTLQGALDALVAADELDVTEVSSVYETEPWGVTDQPTFLNVIVLAESGTDPRELLALCHRIEDRHDRVREERWGPRTLDVDLIAVDDESIVTEDLVLPHARAHERAFVVVPWLELDPVAALPGWGPLAALAAAFDPADVTIRPDLALTLEPGAADE